MSARKHAHKHAMKLARVLDPDGPELLIEFFGSGIMSQAADRIAALEAELAEAKALLRDLREIPFVFNYIDDDNWLARRDALIREVQP